MQDHWDKNKEGSALVVTYSENPPVIRVRVKRGSQPLANPIEVLFKPFEVGRVVRGQSAWRGGRLGQLVVATGIRTLSPLARYAPAVPPSADVGVADDGKHVRRRIDVFWEKA